MQGTIRLGLAVSEGSLVLSLGAALLGGSDLLLLFVDTLGNDGLVVGNLVLLGLGLSLAERAEVTAALQALRSDQSLDLGAVRKERKKLNMSFTETLMASMKGTHALV